MCLKRPVEVLAVDGRTALVSWRGQQASVDTRLVRDVQPGDRLLVHAGLALQRVDLQEAAELERLLSEWDTAGAAAEEEFYGA